MFEMEREHDSGPEATSFDQSININIIVTLSTSFSKSSYIHHLFKAGNIRMLLLFIQLQSSFKYITQA